MCYNKQIYYFLYIYTMSYYSFEWKKNLASKITSIKNKNSIKIIKNIIFNENPNLKYNKNSSGYLLYFENLSDATYQKLDIYVNNFNKIGLTLNGKLNKDSDSDEDSEDDTTTFYKNYYLV